MRALARYGDEVRKVDLTGAVMTARRDAAMPLRLILNPQGSFRQGVPTEPMCLTVN